MSLGVIEWNWIGFSDSLIKVFENCIGPKDIQNAYREKSMEVDSGTSHERSDFDPVTSQLEICVEAEAEAARAARAPQLRSKEDQMVFLISTIQGMEKNITDILLNQKSLERIIETKFHELDIKVIELITTVNQLKHEVDVVHTPSSSCGDDDDTSIPTTT
ncbi:nucleolysin tiar [Hordeum vulgare]|nr:nucleolysin tiar [Hordeum vulgare]